MKKIGIAVPATAAALLAGALAQPARAEVSFDLAYSNLSHHGTWLVSAQYGHVWQPRVYNREWNPYYDGHWAYIEMGWPWVSDYESGPDDIGWAPVPPGFSVGVSMDMGSSSSLVYVSSHEFLAPRVRQSIIPMSRTTTYINNTAVVNNFVIQNNIVVNRGPDVRIIEKATGRPIREERIESVARVSPYDHFDRAQLAVDPERVMRGVRVDEQVPAGRPLPAADNGGKGHRDNWQADVPKASHGKQSDQPNTQESATRPEAVTPTGAAAPAQQPNGKAGAQENAKGQADAKANAQQNAKAQANARAKADHSAKAEANARAKADAKAKKNAPAKKDQGSGLGAAPRTKTEPPR